MEKKSGPGKNIPDPQNWTAVYLAEHDYEARLRLVHHPPELGASARVWSANQKQCCGTGTVGTVTFWLVEPEPEL